MTSTVNDTELGTHRENDDRLAPIMFALSLLFLMLLAALIVMRVDIPRVVELSALESDAGEISNQAATTLAAAEKLGQRVFMALMFLWPLFIAESIYQALRAKAMNASRRQLARHAASAVLPPLRLGTPSTAWGGLLILPILLLEFGFKTLVANHVWLRMLIHVATGFIWFAFATEFVLMMSVTDKKLRYIKKNWLDLAIILLPLISFLRGIRVLRLAKLAKVQQLAKMGRIYRMRGLGMKLFRALLLFEVVNRVLRITPEKQLSKLETLRDEHLEELDEMDAEIAELKTMIDERRKAA